MRGCECCISAKSIHLTLLTWRNLHMKHLKDRSHNAQNRRYGEISSHMIETYNNTVRPHACHFYNTTSGMAMAKMCPFTSEHHGLPHWQCVFRCCDK